MTEKFPASSYSPPKKNTPRINLDLQGGINFNEQEGLNKNWGDLDMSLSDKFRVTYIPGANQAPKKRKSLTKTSEKMMSLQAFVEKDRLVREVTISYEEGQARLRALENKSIAGDELLLDSLEQKIKKTE